DEVNRSQLINLIVGRDLAAVFPKREVRIRDVALELRNLGNSSRGLHGISISVRRGEILGIAGLVGAGRTELAETIFCLNTADSGEILVRGHRVQIQSPSAAIQLGIGYVPEDRRHFGVILDMPITVNTSLATLGTVSRCGLIDAFAERRLAEHYVGSLNVKAS